MAGQAGIEIQIVDRVTVPGRGGKLGNAQDPARAVWDIRGNAYVGPAHALGVNGNGSPSSFVNLDLVVP